MDRIKREAKTILLMVLVLVVLLSLTFASEANAAPVENDDPGLSNGIFNAEYTRLPDDSAAHYMIDISDTTPEEAENNAGENFLEGIQNFNPVGNTVRDSAMEFLNIMVNIGLQWNMMMANMMIGVLNFSFETEIINSWIDGMDGMIREMAGVAGTTITGGIFGALLGFAIVASAVAAIWQLFISRASISGFGTIFKTILAVSLAMILFANFGSLMKGMNEISTTISSSMLTGASNTVTAGSRSPEELREQVSANLWNEFIGRPYMILQYGTDDVEEIGSERVNELLAMPAGEDRQQFIEEVEIAERGNETMTYASVIERLAFTFIFSIINAFVSIPIYGLALALMIFQLWFLMIAFYAPFALIQSAFPGQFKVLQRFAIELTYPLFCKILVTVGTLFIFTLGFMIYSIDINVGISRYFISAFMQFALFGVFFFGRKRIARIVTAGSTGPYDQLNQSLLGLKKSMNDAVSTIGNAGKTAAGVGLGVATGGSFSILASAATAAVASRVNSNDDDETNMTDSVHTRPMIKAEDPKDAVHAPEEREMASEASKPITRIDVEEKESETPERIPQNSTTERIFDQEAPKEEPTQPERDLSKPITRISDIDTESSEEIRIKEEQRLTTIKESESNEK